MKNKLLSKVSLLISDVDGVWTDGGMYVDSNGLELKKFSVYDGGAVILLKLANIPLIVMSGEKNKILENRFTKLKIDDIKLGIKNKKLELERIIKEYHIKKENVLFLGDFINDFHIMKEVGIPVCPINACEEIKRLSKIIIKENGGNGVLWLLTKKILKAKKIYEVTFKNYLDYIDNLKY